MTRSIFALALLAATFSAAAAPTDYVFDSLSKVDVGTPTVSVTGIIQGQTTPTTVTWNDNGNTDYSFLMSRCVPVLLTMLEKPGRYLLNLRVDPAALNFGTISCGLELKN